MSDETVVDQAEGSALRRGVFISYSREHGASAARLVFQFLKSQGFDVFLDVERVSPGRFTEVILNQIGLRDHFVAVITPRTMDALRDSASWPRREIQRAWELKKNVVPLLLEGAAVITVTDKDPFLREVGKLNQLVIPASVLRRRHGEAGLRVSAAADATSAAGQDR